MAATLLTASRTHAIFFGLVCPNFVSINQYFSLINSTEIVDARPTGPGPVGFTRSSTSGHIDLPHPQPTHHTTPPSSSFFLPFGFDFFYCIPLLFFDTQDQPCSSSSPISPPPPRQALCRRRRSVRIVIVSHPSAHEAGNLSLGIRCRSPTYLLRLTDVPILALVPLTPRLLASLSFLPTPYLVSVLFVFSRLAPFPSNTHDTRPATDSSLFHVMLGAWTV